MWLILSMLIMSQKQPVIHPGRLIVRASKGKSKSAEMYLRDHYKIKDIRPLFPITPRTHRDLYDKYRLGDYLIVDFQDKKDKEDLLKVKSELLANQLFEKAEFDYKKIPMYMPNDPELSLQWALFKISSPAAWDITKGDKNVKIVIDDTGVDWRHEDLLDNLWQNLGEDADGDGHVIELVNGEWQFDPGDINGVDDDGDGLADDFIGWNYYAGSNDPQPDTTQDGYYHGTHVAGICSAVADNGIGVASVAFSASIVASRSYWLSNSSSALQWAGDMGFDVFNMSWGTYSNVSYLESAINYAHDAGVLLVAAAGNEETSDSLYPAAYANVIAVAATNRNDQHSYYTNYGDYIDIAAPGGDGYVDPMIYSTMPDSSYDYLQGTSMASPMLASVAGLVKAANPFLSNDNIRDILLNTADSINDTLYEQGQLGAGRVNAYKAVREAARMLRAFVIADSIDVSPERPLSGDTVVFNITVLDSAGWQQATDLQVSLRSDNPNFVLLDTTVFVGNLSAGSRQTATFRGFVPDNFKPADVHFVISYSTSGYIVERTDEFDKLIGHPYILVVDDANDSGAYLDYYTTSLDTLGFVYDVRDIAQEGVPSVSGTWGLSSYQAVIWYTGDDTTTLNQEEIDTLTSSIDRGVNVFISSQNLAERLNNSTFLTDYLGAGFDTSGISDVFVKGVMGDPIGDSISLAIAGVGGAQNASSKDVIHAEGSGVVFLGYGTDGTNGGAGVRNEKGSAKIVFISFPFEAINGQVSGQNTRVEFLGKVLSWMGLTGIKEQASPKEHIKWNGIVLRRGTKVLDISKIYKGARQCSVYSVSGRKVLNIKNGILHADRLHKGIYIIQIPSMRKNVKLLKLE